MKTIKLMRGALIVNVSLMAVLLGGCNSTDEPNDGSNDRYDIELSEQAKSAATILSDFYVNFTADAVSCVDANANVTDKNVVVSPLSVYMSLSMLANGTGSETSKKITNYLGVDDIETLNQLASVLLQELPKVDNQSEMAIANSCWIDKSNKFDNSFANTVTQSYNAWLLTEDFTQKSVVDKINSWCSENTNGKISKLTDDVSLDVVAMLINTLYYKGEWAGTPFDKAKTEKAEFHGIDRTTEVEMMYAKESRRNFYMDDNFAYYSLRFGNGAFAFQVALPSEELTSEEATRLLTADQWRKFSTGSVSCYLTIYMPKFKSESRLSLNDVFKSGGFDFCDNIDFNLIQPSVKGRALFEQSTFLEINETGAEVAVVTNNNMTSADAEEGGTYTVKVDRPFYFRIVERSTNACLLSGRIADL